MHVQEFGRGEQDEALAMHDWLLVMPRDTENHCGVAVRKHLIQDDPQRVNILHEQCEKGKFQAVLVMIVLSHGLGGLESLCVGSFHINNEHAKKPVACRTTLKGFFARVAEYEVDVLGFDCNRGLGALINTARTMPGDEDVGGPKFLLAPPDECVGMVVPKSSRLLGMRLQNLVSYSPVPGDLGLREGDTDWHEMVLAHWVPADQPHGARMRASETKAERKRRQKHARKKRHRAGPGSLDPSGPADPDPSGPSDPELVSSTTSSGSGGSRPAQATGRSDTTCNKPMCSATWYEVLMPHVIYL